MTLLRLAVILVAGAIAASHASGIKGVDPSLAHLYEAVDGKFKCIDSDTSISYAALNDDYCDCPDGSDEPGTSACSGHHHTPHFYCHNTGFFPAKIHLSRIGDGICEEDCCDGSDEAQGVCPNTCEQRGQQHRLEQAHSERIRDKALITKRSYIDSARRELERLRKVVRDKQDAADKAAHKEKVAKGECLYFSSRALLSLLTQTR